MIGGGGQRRAPRGAKSWEWQPLRPGAAPRADPRAGPAVSRQNFPALRRSLAGGRTERMELPRALGFPPASFWGPLPLAALRG